MSTTPPTPTPSNPRGGGAIIVGCLFAGTVIGFFLGQATIGFLIGTGVGIAIAVALIMGDRSRS